MATTNPWTRFKALLPASQRYSVTITEVLPNGTSLAERRDGATVRLNGSHVAAGQRAWVEGQQIIGPAPSLIEYVQFV